MARVAARTRGDGRSDVHRLMTRHPVARFTSRVIGEDGRTDRSACRGMAQIALILVGRPGGVLAVLDDERSVVTLRAASGGRGVQGVDHRRVVTAWDLNPRSLVAVQ